MDVTARARSDVAFNERYELTDKLGEGGMGSVHRGRQRALNRAVAIKFMAPELAQEPGYVNRFMAEAQLAASLVHGSVVAVFDFGLVAGVPYLVTEFIPGQTLADLLKETGTLSVPDTLAVARSVLDGLAAIHQLGIVHRDIKPANLLVMPGSPPHVKILDFGIAKQTTGAPLSDAPKTATGMVMGTPEYMAPEQAAGDALTPAADIYAFSLVLYRMVVGHHPFRASTTLELLRMQIHADATVPDHILPEFRDLLLAGLAKRPADRVGSAVRMRELVDRAAPAAERLGSFSAGTPAAYPVEDVPTPRARDVATVASVAAPRPVEAAGPSAKSLGLAIVAALALVAALRPGAPKPPETWNHAWAAPFVKVPASRSEPVQLDTTAQTYDFRYDDVNKLTPKDHVANLRRLADGSSQFDLTFDTRDNWMSYSDAFSFQEGGLLATSTPRLAWMTPGPYALIDDGAMEVDYRGTVNPGKLELQLLNARHGDSESGVIYRLRVDQRKPGWELMVSAPEECHAEIARGNYQRSFRFDPTCWRMVARYEDASLAKQSVVRLHAVEHTLTATINGADHPYELGDDYRVKPGALYPRLYVYPETSLKVERVSLAGKLARGEQCPR